MPKVSRFAHLLGLRAMAGDSSLRGDEGDREEEDAVRKARSRKVEEEKQEKGAEDEEEDDDDLQGDEDGEGPQEDEDPEGEKDGDDEKDPPAVKKGRQAERRRCARIFSSRFAAVDPALAAAIAFDTGMSSAQAITVMSSSRAANQATPTPTRVTLDERMANVQKIRLGQDTTPAPVNTAQRMAALYNRVKGVNT
ncbi:hypothetical protein [Tatumella saanichensis]|uniref:hypothetical protein n=1 Tax=Tatumella saanichensis TaxID=480813 RepID=UPI0004A38B5C|nr:hypothetical protein [Tatumella saanichensis]